MGEITSPFRLIADSFAKEKIPFILIGGYAVIAHKFSRLTQDIDFLVSETDRERAIQALGKEAYQSFHSTPLFTRFKSNIPGMLVVDLLYVDSKTMLVISKEGKEIVIDGRTFVIPSLLHLIALKLHALKNSPRLRESKDLLDIVGLVKENAIDIESDEFKKVCEKYGASSIHQRLLQFFGKTDGR